MGNGHDTLFLAQHSQHVYAFDIQQEAIDHTQLRLEKNKLTAQATLIHAGHETMQQHLPKKQKADVIVFNLGYLPHANPDIITQTDNTLIALDQALSYLSEKGIISILAYPGHAGGLEEMQAIITWSLALHDLGFSVHLIRSLQEKPTSPRLFMVQNGLNKRN